MTANANNLTPVYQNPPVEEVACGCQFKPLDRLKFAHLGLLWERFRREFPLSENAPPIADAGTVPPIEPATNLPWPRVWFINQAESRLLQFQANRLHFNWRRRPAEPAYPHYPEMIGRFTDYFSVLEKFVAEFGLGVIDPVAYEMTYINHIGTGSGWKTIADLSHVFKDFLWTNDKKRYLPDPDHVAWQAVFLLPDHAGRLSVKLNEAKTAVDSETFLLLELTARGMGQDKSSARVKEWFDLAHEWIVKGFTDLTTPEVQNDVWGRER